MQYRNTTDTATTSRGGKEECGTAQTTPRNLHEAYNPLFFIKSCAKNHATVAPNRARRYRSCRRSCTLHAECDRKQPRTQFRSRFLRGWTRRRPMTKSIKASRSRPSGAPVMTRTGRWRIRAFRLTPGKTALANSTYAGTPPRFRPPATPDYIEQVVDQAGATTPGRPAHESGKLRLMSHVPHPFRIICSPHRIRRWW